MSDADDISLFLWSTHFFHLTPLPFLNQRIKTRRVGLESAGLVWKVWNIADDLINSMETGTCIHTVFKWGGGDRESQTDKHLPPGTFTGKFLRKADIEGLVSL